MPVGVVSGLELTQRWAYAELGCNEGRGRLRVRDDRLLVRRLLTTAMACPDDDRSTIDHAVSTVLTADPTWRIEGDVLTLTSHAGTLTYRAHD